MPPAFSLPCPFGDSAPLRAVAFGPLAVGVPHFSSSTAGAPPQGEPPFGKAKASSLCSSGMIPPARSKGRPEKKPRGAGSMLDTTGGLPVFYFIRGRQLRRRRARKCP